MERFYLPEALFGGMTANAFKLGTVLTGGWFWARPGGCCVLYRGPSIETVDLGRVLSVECAESQSISPPAWVSHDGGGGYIYVIRRVNGCGCGEHSFSASVQVEFDQGGQLRAAEPNVVLHVTAAQHAGDRVRVAWLYKPLEQGCEPVCFRIYGDGGSGGQVDYGTALGSIDYAGGRFYVWDSGQLETGVYRFAVRSQEREGRQNRGWAVVRAEVRASETPAAEILMAESV